MWRWQWHSKEIVVITVDHEDHYSPVRAGSLREARRSIEIVVNFQTVRLSPCPDPVDGYLPAWAASVLTSASLFLAFLIQLRDKHKALEERANTLVSWLEPADHLRRQSSVVLYNGGPVPVPRILLWSADHKHHPPQQCGYFIHQQSKKTLLPGGQVGYEIRDLFRDNRTYYIDFFDSRGQRWVRDIRTDRYVSTRKIRRWDQVANSVSDHKAPVVTWALNPRGNRRR